MGNFLSREKLNQELGAIFIREVLPVGNVFYTDSRLEKLVDLANLFNISFEPTNNYTTYILEGSETRKNVNRLCREISRQYRDSSIGKEWYFSGSSQNRFQLLRRNMYLQIGITPKESDYSEMIPILEGEEYLGHLDNILSNFSSDIFRFNSTKNRVYGFEELMLEDFSKYKDTMNYINSTRFFNKLKFVFL